jgi:hypothetical protein
MNTWTSQTVIDQLTSMLAERRRLGRDRRSAAYLSLAHAIVSDGPADQFHLLQQQPASIADWRGHAA